MRKEGIYTLFETLSMKQFDRNNPAQQESSTAVYLLVEELNIFL